LIKRLCLICMHMQFNALNIFCNTSSYPSKSDHHQQLPISSSVGIWSPRCNRLASPCWRGRYLDRTADFPERRRGDADGGRGDEVIRGGREDAGEDARADEKDVGSAEEATRTDEEDVSELTRMRGQLRSKRGQGRQGQAEGERTAG